MCDNASLPGDLSGAGKTEDMRCQWVKYVLYYIHVLCIYAYIGTRKLIYCARKCAFSIVYLCISVCVVCKRVCVCEFMCVRLCVFVWWCECVSCVV